MKRKKPRVDSDRSNKEPPISEEQALSHARGERAWEKLAAPDGQDESWEKVEDNLLTKDQQENHAARRWKYFSK